MYMIQGSSTFAPGAERKSRVSMDAVPIAAFLSPDEKGKYLVM